jgi:hypothetical protein
MSDGGPGRFAQTIAMLGDRLRLLFGPYRTPRFRYGQRVFCEARGWVKIIGLSDGPIPWPYGQRPGVKAKALILYADLARAVRREAAQAVAVWWGVGMYTVWKWRKALGVPKFNEGTRQVKRDNFLGPAYLAARKRAWAKARDPERRAKIGAALRGKPRPAHVIEAVRKAQLGIEQSLETRRKRSEAHRRLGTRPPKAGQPWTAAEDRLVHLLRPAEVAKRTGRTLQAAWRRRQQLGLRDGRAGRSVNPGG